MDQVQSLQIQLWPLAKIKSDRKSVSEGGFGGAPGFPILSDRDLSLSASCGVARWVNKTITTFESSITLGLSRQGVWLSCQGDSHRGLVGQLALHGRSQDRHPQVIHVALLVHVVRNLYTHTLAYLLFAAFLHSQERG